MSERVPLFSFRKKDFRVDTFRSGGKGGQHQNKTDSGVRITHVETGISAESRAGRSQHANKKLAFRKLADKLVKHFCAKDKRERYGQGPSGSGY
jgi:protein subunit release factor A